jgi:hypothetical protein
MPHPRRPGCPDRSPSPCSNSAADMPRPRPAPNAQDGSRRNRDETSVPPPAPHTAAPPSARFGPTRSERRAPEPRCHPLSVSAPPAPAAGNTSPRTSDSTACRDCLSGHPQTQQSTPYRHPRRARLALTCQYASHTTHLEISNGFATSDLGVLTGSSRLMTVDRRPHPDGPSPSLRPHYQASPLLRDSPPLCPASVLCPWQFLLLGVLPPATARPPTASSAAPVSGRQVPTFRTRAQAKLAPPPCRTPPGQ